MAEAFPEEEASVDRISRESEMSLERTELQLPSDEGAISVLLLATKWQFDTYGVSTVNRSLVNNLRFVDPDGSKIKITCAVVEEEETINKTEQGNDADSLKVKLMGARQPRGPKEKPDIRWLDRSTATYYGHVMEDNMYDYIVSHPRIWQTVVLILRTNIPKDKSQK